MKATSSSQVNHFKDIPNIGPAMTKDFKLLGIWTPADLKKQDPLKLYKQLCVATNSRQDPCVLDTFMAAVDFMNAAPAHPWWHYTEERKRTYPNI